jgi:hypothetical protein
MFTQYIEHVFGWMKIQKRTNLNNTNLFVYEFEFLILRRTEGGKTCCLSGLYWLSYSREIMGGFHRFREAFLTI